MGLRWIKRWWQEYDFIPEYFAAIGRAWQGVIWGNSVLAIAMVVWWALGHPPARVTAAWLVIAMFLAGYSTWRAYHVRLIPKLGIAAQAEIQPTRANVGRSIFVQVTPVCLGEEPVEGCEGHLLRVLKRGPQDADWQETTMNEPLLLEWSHSNNLPHTVQPGIDKHLNICTIHSGDRRLMPCSGAIIPMRWLDVWNAWDDYRFDVQLTAPNCPPVAFAVEYLRGDTWDQPKVTLVPLAVSREQFVLQRAN